MDGLKKMREIPHLFMHSYLFLSLVRTDFYVLYIHLAQNSYRRMQANCLLLYPSSLISAAFLFDLNPSMNHFFNDSFFSYLAGTFKS